MHKNPVKFRFIIGSRTCATKQIAKKLVQILKLISRILKRYCNKVRFYTGIERYWIVDNNEVVLDSMESINKKASARNIETYDFSTLYTKIPLQDLKDKLKRTVEKAFKGGNNQYIRVTKEDARWHHCKRDDTFSKEDIFKMIDIIVDNSFFRFGNRVFRQSIGIPMGIDPAPQMANLYHHYYESTFMVTLTKENFGMAKKFNNTRRYIDDLVTLNNDGHLQANVRRIYPEELKLNKENENNKVATFLDIEASIQDGRFHTKTYDKREAFEIVNYPDLSGNIPAQPAYGVYTSQIIRYAKICSHTEDLVNRIMQLPKKLVGKGFTREKLKITLRNCLKKHRWIASKHQIDHRLSDGWLFGQ